jgi:thiol-disulfide isomerase/thioredoxin
MAVFVRPCLHSFAAALWLVAHPAANASHAPGVGDVPPALVGKTLEGKVVSVTDYAGKVVIVSFWASWCPPCMKELPVLENIQRAGKGGIQVIAVNTQSAADFRRIAMTMTAFQLLLTRDAGDKGWNAYGVRGIPHMIIIGRNGRIVRVNRGYDKDHLPQIADDINRALAVAVDSSSSP